MNKILFIFLILFFAFVENAYSQYCPSGECPKSTKTAQKPVESQEDIDGLKQKAEVILRGNSVVSTVPEIQSTEQDLLIRALALPDDDNNKYYCMLFHSEQDSVSKCLLNDWKTNETLLAIANPGEPTGKISLCKFITVNVDDPTVKDLLKGNEIKNYPTVVIQSANYPVEGIPAKTTICKIEGYDGKIDSYSSILEKSLKKGLKKALNGSLEAIEQTASNNIINVWNVEKTGKTGLVRPNIPVTTTLEKQDVDPKAGLSVNVLLPEESGGAFSAMGEFFKNCSELVKWLFIAVIIFILPIIIKLFGVVWNVLLYIFNLWLGLFKFSFPEGEETKISVMKKE